MTLLCRLNRLRRGHPYGTLDTVRRKEDSHMVYVCKNCHFEFERSAKDVEQCPDCGMQYCIRSATPEEKAQFQIRKKEILLENR